jgi:hypothetical protein
MRQRTLLAVGITIALVVGLNNRNRDARIDTWPAGADSGASVARRMSSIIGAPAALLAGCGPRHVLVAYVDAPGDLRSEWGRDARGGRTHIISMAQQRRHTVAATIASVYFSVAGEREADTVSVELVREKHWPSGVGPDRIQYVFIQNPDHSYPAPPLWLNAVTTSCERAI